MTSIPSNSLTSSSSGGVGSISSNASTTVPFTHASTSISGDAPQTTAESAPSVVPSSRITPSFMQDMLMRYSTPKQTSTAPLTETKADRSQKNRPRVKRTLTNSEKPQTTQNT